MVQRDSYDATKLRPMNNQSTTASQLFPSIKMEHGHVSADVGDNDAEEPFSGKDRSEAELHESFSQSHQILEEDGGSAISALIGWILLVVLGAGLFFYAKKIKLHQKFREYFPVVGQVCLQLGIDKHETFTLKCVIHEILMEDLKSYRVELVALHQQSTSEIGDIRPSKRIQGVDVVSFEDVIELEVPQGSSKVTFKLLTAEKLEFLADAKIDVDKLLSFVAEDEEAGEPKERTFDMTRTSRGKKHLIKEPKIVLSFHMEESSDKQKSKDQGKNLVLLKGLPLDKCSKNMRMRLETLAKKKAKNMDASQELSFKDLTYLQLEMMASFAEGDLAVHAGFFSQKNNVQRYALNNSKGKRSLSSWRFAWWEDAQSLKDGEQPVGEIPVLQISRIAPAKSQQGFVVTYVVESEDLDVDLNLSSVDQPRDVWVEALQTFIVHLRTVRHKLAEGREDKEEKSSDKKRKKKSSHHSGTGDMGGTSDKESDQSHGHRSSSHHGISSESKKKKSKSDEEDALDSGLESEHGAHKGKKSHHPNHSDKEEKGHEHKHHSKHSTSHKHNDDD
jgi:hypothetical protein